MARSASVLALTGAMITATLALTSCAGLADGDALAHDGIATQADRLAKKLGHRERVRDAEYIAATELPSNVESGNGTELSMRVVPIAWSGRVTGNERATIDVRFTATVEGSDGNGFGDRGHSAGQDVRCYRYVLELYRYTTYHEIDCPAATAFPTPSASPIPRLPADAQQRLTAALRTATPASLDTAVRSAFPESHVVVDTAVHEGSLVAAVGVPAERECLLMVRTPNGAITSPGFDRIWLEPGEAGCSVSLFISPPR